MIFEIFLKILKFLGIQPNHSTKHYVMMVNPVGFTEAAMKRGDAENSRKMHLNRS